VITEIDGRAILFENDDCRKHGLMASCNCCERIIYADEMTPLDYEMNGGYCFECIVNEFIMKATIKEYIRRANRYFSGIPDYIPDSDDICEYVLDQFLVEGIPLTDEDEALIIFMVTGEAPELEEE